MDEPKFDGQIFLDTFRNVASSVTAVTTYSERGEPRGLTVSSFASVSLDPPLVLVCIGDESNSLDALYSHGGFTINFLAEGTAATALLLASPDNDKFDEVRYVAPAHPVAGPVLTEVAFAFFECRTQEAIDAGDHWIFIGRILTGDVLDDRPPLVYHRRTFVRVRE